MQVKKFEAPTIAEAIKLVKTELGPDAIILSTKNNRKGFGLLSKASVEVTAAVSDKSLAKKSITEKTVPPQTKEKLQNLPAAKQSEIYEEFTDYYTRRHKARKEATRGVGASKAGSVFGPAPGEQIVGTPVRTPLGQQPLSPNIQKTSSPPRYVDITDEDDGAQTSVGYGRNGRVSAAATGAVHADVQSARIGDGRVSVRGADGTSASRPHVADLVDENEAVAGLAEDIQRLKEMLAELKAEQIAIVDSKVPDQQTEEMQVEFQNLLRNGVDKRYATQLIKQVSFAIPREAQADSGKIVEAVAVEMMNMLKTDHPLDFKSGNGTSRVFALVGPTGVGKTTTIAKLASQAILQKNLRVGLINVDSYKVAALDQLATYAKILNVPFRQASNALELDRALQEFKPLDLVLIDTSGRSQRDTDSLSQMRALLSENTAVRPLLIVSATTRDQELYDIITRFKIFSPTGLVFSKLDESATFGCIYNVSQKTGLPLTYFTVGQRVPEDIEPASRERVADLILDL